MDIPTKIIVKVLAMWSGPNYHNIERTYSSVDIHLLFLLSG